MLYQIIIAPSLWFVKFCYHFRHAEQSALLFQGTELESVIRFVRFTVGSSRSLDNAIKVY